MLLKTLKLTLNNSINFVVGNLPFAVDHITFAVDITFLLDCVYFIVNCFSFVVNYFSFVAPIPQPPPFFAPCISHLPTVFATPIVFSILHQSLSPVTHHWFPFPLPSPPRWSLQTVAHQHLPYPLPPTSPFDGLPVFETIPLPPKSGGPLMFAISTPHYPLKFYMVKKRLLP